MLSSEKERTTATLAGLGARWRRRQHSIYCLWTQTSKLYAASELFRRRGEFAVGDEASNHCPPPRARRIRGACRRPRSSQQEKKTRRFPSLTALRAKAGLGAVRERPGTQLEETTPSRGEEEASGLTLHHRKTSTPYYGRSR